MYEPVPRRPSDGLFVCLLRDVLHRRRAVYARKQKTRQECGGPFFHLHRRFPGYVFQVGRRQCIEALKVAGREGRPPNAFEQQVVQAERKVEGRIAKPCAFRIS